jgi:large subunit ribosomal protein L23
MGLFSKKKEEAVVEAPKKAVSKAAKSPKTAKAKATKAQATTPAVSGASTVAASAFGRVILRPRITEKATMKAETENVYVFEVADTANKVTVRKAVADMYKVNPTRIAIAYNPAKKVFRRGHMGMTSGVKKAYVYLKKGDKIEIV